MKKIDKELIKKAQELAKQTEKLENIITDRIDYVIRTVFKLFNQKLVTWYFYGAGEGELGNLWSNYDDETVDIITEKSTNGKEEPIIIDKNGNEFEFYESIPTRWLFEDFEQELIDGKKKFEEQKLKQKKKLEIKKKEDQILIELVKKKLTKKELAVIKKLK